MLAGGENELVEGDAKLVGGECRLAGDLRRLNGVSGPNNGGQGTFLNYFQPRWVAFCASAFAFIAAPPFEALSKFILLSRPFFHFRNCRARW